MKNLRVLRRKKYVKREKKRVERNAKRRNIKLHDAWIKILEVRKVKEAVATKNPYNRSNKAL